MSTPKPHTRLVMLPLALYVVVGLATCNDYPVHSLLETFEVRVTDKLTNDQPVKLDFLWVLDHSPSMCQEQRELAKGFKELTKALGTFGEGAIDAQMAVVTVQQAPDKQEIRVVGRFKHTPATVYPPNCFERIRTNCLSGSQCSNPAPYKFQTSGCSSLCNEKTSAEHKKTLKKGKWKCEGPKSESGTIKASKVSNLNCSLNTQCVASCTKGASGDKFCCDLFEGGKDCTVECSVAGGGAGVGGCIFQPDTKKCPKPQDLPAVIGQKDLDKFGCIATVGAAQTQESKFEGGFRSAWMALDPDGPNCKYKACVDSLRSCCAKKEKWCTETNPAVIKQNKAKCTKEKVELCEYLTPYGACKRKIKSCCKGPHDEACLSHTDKKKCDAEVKSKCNKLKGKTDVVTEACQATRLMRQDGYLVLVFVSDDDDCSMHLNIHPHDKTKMTKEIWEKCQIHNDSLIGNRALAEGHCEFKQAKSEGGAKSKAMWCPEDCVTGSKKKTPDGLDKCKKGCKEGSKEQVECQAKADAQIEFFDKEKQSFYKYKSNKEHLAGWQFAPVSEFVNRFKSLKDDPAKVIVASIAGDTKYENTKAKTSKDFEAVEAQKNCDRVEFYHAMKKDVGPGQAPNICLGKRGEASYGSRYIQLAEAFRENGVTFNICKGSDFGPALRGIAEQILKRVVKICLPAPPETDESGQLRLKVTHSRGGKTTELKSTPCDSSKELCYSIQQSADCRAGKVGLAGDGSNCKLTRDCTSGLHCKKECAGTKEQCQDVAGRCLPYTQALFFNQTLDEQDLIEVNFKADMGL